MAGTEGLTGKKRPSQQSKFDKPLRDMEGLRSPESAGFRCDTSLALVVAIIGMAIVMFPPETRESFLFWMAVMLLLSVYPILHLAEWLSSKVRLSIAARTLCYVVPLGLFFWFGAEKYPAARRIPQTHYVRPPTIQSTEPPVVAHAKWEMEIETFIRLNSTPSQDQNGDFPKVWALNGTYVYPVDAMIAVWLTNHETIPATINDMDVYWDDIGEHPVKLGWIDTRSLKILLGPLDDAHEMLETPFLDREIEGKSLPPSDRVRGWVLLCYPKGSGPFGNGIYADPGKASFVVMSEGRAYRAQTILMRTPDYRQTIHWRAGAAVDLSRLTQRPCPVY